MNRNITTITFSPTHSTQKVALAIAKSISESLSISEQEADIPENGNISQIDITPYAARANSLNFGSEDIVIVGAPTYAGRIPNKIMPYYRDSIKGNGALAIALVTYGNRAYDDALKEMAELLTQNGFMVIAAAAFLGQHSFTDKLATGRPNADDLTAAAAFGASVGGKITEAARDPQKLKLDISKVPGRSISEMEYYKPVKTDGKPAAFLKVKPKTHESECNGCGKCREICPMNCFVNDLVVPEGTCIKCMACVADCPNKAKYFTDEDLAGHRMMLEGNFADIYRKIETFM